jgi:chitodextrinase
MNVVLMNTIKAYVRKCSFLLILSVIAFFSCGDDFADDIKRENDRFVSPVAGDGGLLTVSDKKVDSFVLSWAGATDERTPSSELRYRVVLSTDDILSTYVSIDEFILSQKAFEATAGWTLGINTITVSSLTSRTSYFCNVFVRDTDDCVSAYSCTKVSLDNGNSPVPGNSGSLSAEWISGYVKLSWALASDLETPSENLLYKVFRTVPNPTDDCTSVKVWGNSLAVEKTTGWSQSIDTLSVSNLLPDSTYWFNVFVMDLHDNISAYTPVSLRTPVNAPPVIADNICKLTSSGTSQYITWTKAADDYSSTILYRVYASLNSSAVSSYTENTTPVSNLVITSSTTSSATVYELTSGWVSDIDTIMLPVLSDAASATNNLEGVPVYFAVFVRDVQNLKSSYSILSLKIQNGVWIVVP